MDWMKVGSALLLVAMMIFVWPAAKRMMTESPAAEQGDWRSAIDPPDPRRDPLRRVADVVGLGNCRPPCRITAV